MFNCFRFDIRSSFKFQVSSFRFHPSLFTVHYSLAKRCFALSPRLLRAEGPSAPCSWPASAVRVTSEMQCKVTKNIDAKKHFLCFIFDLFEMLKFKVQALTP